MCLCLSHGSSLPCPASLPPCPLQSLLQQPSTLHFFLPSQSSSTLFPLFQCLSCLPPPPKFPLVPFPKQFRRTFLVLLRTSVTPLSAVSIACCENAAAALPRSFRVALHPHQHALLCFCAPTKQCPHLRWWFYSHWPPSATWVGTCLAVAFGSRYVMHLLFFFLYSPVFTQYKPMINKPGLLVV